MVRPLAHYSPLVVTLLHAVNVQPLAHSDDTCVRATRLFQYIRLPKDDNINAVLG